MTNTSIKTPLHLWIVGVLSILWNAGGAYDYVATQYRLESYMSQLTPEMLEYINAYPSWMEMAWAIGIWGAVLGSVFLLLRQSFAVWLFGVSILGLAVSTIYNFILSDATAVMGNKAAVFTFVIWIIALILFFYSRFMARRRVLR